MPPPTAHQVGGGGLEPQLSRSEKLGGFPTSSLDAKELFLKKFSYEEQGGPPKNKDTPSTPEDPGRRGLKVAEDKGSHENKDPPTPEDPGCIGLRAAEVDVPPRNKDPSTPEDPGCVGLRAADDVLLDTCEDDELYGYYDTLMSNVVVVKDSARGVQEYDDKRNMNLMHDVQSGGKRNVMSDVQRGDSNVMSDVQRGDGKPDVVNMVTLSLFNQPCKVPSSKTGCKRVPPAKKGSPSMAELKSGLKLRGWLKKVPPVSADCVGVDASKAGMNTDCVVGVTDCEPEAPGGLGYTRNTAVLECVRDKNTCVTHGCMMTRVVLEKLKSITTPTGEVTRKVANVSWVCRLHSEYQLSLSASKGGLVTTAVCSLTNENVRILSHD